MVTVSEINIITSPFNSVTCSSMVAAVKGPAACGLEDCYIVGSNILQYKGRRSAEKRKLDDDTKLRDGRRKGSVPYAGLRSSAASDDEDEDLRDSRYEFWGTINRPKQSWQTREQLGLLPSAATTANRKERGELAITLATTASKVAQITPALMVSSRASDKALEMQWVTCTKLSA